MVDQVNLTPVTQQVLKSLQRTSDHIDKTTDNIASGQKVNSALDSPTAFFKAQGLNQRVGDLLAVKDDMSQAMSTIEAASIGLRSLATTIEQMRAVVTGARGGSAAERQSAAELFDQLGQQLDSLASDARYSGVSLTSGSPDTLEVSINDNDGTLSISGTAADSAGLGIGSAVTDFNGLASDADIDAVLAQLDGAATTIRARERSFQTDVSVLSVREKFTQGLNDVLGGGADKLIAADLEEDAVNLLALQVRQNLGTASLNLVAEKNNAIASLF
jgi:flagellin